MRYIQIDPTPEQIKRRATAIRRQRERIDKPQNGIRKHGVPATERQPAIRQCKVTLEGVEE